jgi:hypothetical protein
MHPFYRAHWLHICTIAAATLCTLLALAVETAYLAGSGAGAHAAEANDTTFLIYLPLVQGPQPQASLSPETLDFGSHAANTASEPQQVILTSSGDAPLTVSSIYLERWEEFNLLDTGTCSGTTPFTLDAGASCTIHLIFYPPDTFANYTDTLNVASNASDAPHTAALEGRSTDIALSLSPDVVDFGLWDANNVSNPLQVTLTSSGSAPLTVSSIYLERWKEFNLLDTGTCPNTTPFTLDAGASCTVDVVFYSPLTFGQYSDTLNVASSAPGGLASITVNGTSVR